MLKLRVVEGGRPEATAPSEDAMLKVAFATQDLRTLDAHFASARNIAIYEVAAESYRFLEAIHFEGASGENGIHTEPGDDRITPRIEAIDGCALLFVLAIGGPAAARVVSRRIHPVKLPRPEPIGDICERVRTMLNGNPPPWLRRAVRGGTAEHARQFIDEEDDG
jgi:nitrogen fixation protein NifX